MHPDKMPGLIPNQKKEREREKILVIAGSFCQTVPQMKKKKKRTQNMRKIRKNINGH